VLQKEGRFVVVRGLISRVNLFFSLGFIIITSFVFVRFFFFFFFCLRLPFVLYDSDAFSYDTLVLVAGGKS